MPKSNIVQNIVDKEHQVEDAIGDVVHEIKFNFKPKTIAGRKLRIFFKKTFPVWFGRNYRYVFAVSLALVIALFSFHKIYNLQSHLATIKIEKITLVDKNKELHAKLTIADNELSTLRERLAGSSFVIVNKQTLLNDMTERFSSISPRVAKIIVDTVIEEAKKYDINPIILYSLGVVESSHRYWIEHPKSLISIPQESGKGYKKIHAEAVGWGGVMWEHHYKMLIDKNIAKTRADLFYPDVNIRAAAAIYNMYFHMDKKDGVKNQDVSAQRRYFGGNYKSYSDKINAQVVELVNAEIYRTNITEKENVK
jgi:hypothetical protein